MADLRKLSKIMRIGSIILGVSGIIDYALWFYLDFHAPSWVLGVSWIVMAILLAVIPVTWREDHAGS